MSLHIRFTLRSDIICPHCGEIVTTKDEDIQSSGGPAWYVLLEMLGYYDERTDDNDWYGKDMVLSREQIETTYNFVKNNLYLYNAYIIRSMVAMAKLDKQTVVVNADW